MSAEGAPREHEPVRGGSEPREPNYTGEEWRRAVVPALLVMTLVALALLAWGLTHDVGTDVVDPLPDISDDGDFTLDGAYREEATAYGPHAMALNLTLLEGDRLVLRYSASGPGSGVQVRLQHPLHPSDGTDGTGGTDVHASSEGTGGAMVFIAKEPGAYQLYFMHPAATRERDDGDDPAFRSPARVSWVLVVERADRLQW